MITLAYFLGLSLILIGDKMCLTQYCSSNHVVSLISDIHKQYGTYSIVLSSSAHYECTFKWMTLAHQLSKDLSRKKISSATVNFDKLNEMIVFYRRRILRPIIIVLLDTLQDIAEFETLSKKIDMNYPIWLMIFTNEMTNALCEYCMAPNANKFTLQFNTEMLVYCCCNANKQLSEWWSSDGIHIDNTYFGYWTRDTGLVRLNNNTIYSRRSNLNGKNLKIIYINGSSSIRVNQNGITGFFGDFLTELSHIMNFTITPAMCERDKIGNVFSYHKADIGATELDLNRVRDKTIARTLPLMITTYRLYFKQGSSQIKWSEHFQLFEVNVWMAVLALILLASVILTVIKYYMSTYSSAILISENFLHVWGIFCQQGLSEIPTYTPLKIAFFSICLSAIIISASYSAAFISSLAVWTFDSPFNSFHEFIHESSYKLIVCKDSADYQYFALSEEPMLKMAMSKLKPNDTLPITTEDGLEQVCSEKVVFFVAQVRKLAAKPPSCKLSSVDTGVISPITMLMSPNSPYIELINYHIHKFQQSGFLQRLKAKYLLKPNNYARNLQFSPVTLRKVIPILVFVTAGIIIAAVCLAIEKLYFLCNNCRLSQSQSLNDLKVKQFKDSFATYKAKHKKYSTLKFKATNPSRKLPYPMGISYL